MQTRQQLPSIDVLGADVPDAVLLDVHASRPSGTRGTSPGRSTCR